MIDEPECPANRFGKERDNNSSDDVDEVRDFELRSREWERLNPDDPTGENALKLWEARSGKTSTDSFASHVRPPKEDSETTELELVLRKSDIISLRKFAGSKRKRPRDVVSSWIQKYCSGGSLHTGFPVNSSFEEVSRDPAVAKPIDRLGAPASPYTKTDALTDLFAEEAELDTMLARLKRKKNLVLTGPPGVGKTFVAKRLAYLAMQQRDESRVAMVQFHQSYSYEDFIQGFRPHEGGGFRRKDGVFLEFVRCAQRDLQRDYFFIIDEINRGNLSKIFGELMMLLEADKRGPDYALPLTYAEGASDTFYLPENLHLIGTMNTADRSVSLVDYALRRRFAFYDIAPKFASTRFADWLRRRGADATLIEKIQLRLPMLNAEIAALSDLGRGFCLGHSYFCPPADIAPDEAWYREVIESEIGPLLEEYFEKPETARAQVAQLLA